MIKSDFPLSIPRLGRLTSLPKLSALVTITVLVIVALGGVSLRRVEAQVAPAPSTTPTPTATPFLSDFVVLLGTLPRNGTTDLTPAFRNALTAAAFPGYRVTITALPANRPVTNRATALEAAKTNPKAIAVVYGLTDPETQQPIGVIELVKQGELERNLVQFRQGVTLDPLAKYSPTVHFPIDAKLDAKVFSPFIQSAMYIASADYARAATVNAALLKELANSPAKDLNKFVGEVDFMAGYLGYLNLQSSTVVVTLEKLTRVGRDSELRAPLRALSLSNLAAIQILIEEYEDATTSLSSAIQLDKTLSYAHALQAIAYFYDEEEDRAADSLDVAIELDPNNIYALNDRGWLHYIADERNEALEKLSAAINLEPRFADAYLNRAVLYRSGGANQNAIADLTKAIEFAPNYAVAYNLRGGTYYRIGNLNAALADINQAIFLFPDYTNALVTRGFIYEALGEIEKAFRDYDRVVSIDSSLSAGYFNRGRINIKRNQFEPAILDLTISIQLEGRRPSPEAYFYRAQANQGAKRWDEAIRDYNEYLRLDANGEFAIAARESVRAIRAFLPPTTTPTRTSTRTFTPTRTPAPSITPTRTPTRVISPIPSRTFVPTFTRIPTLTNPQIIGTSVALTLTVQARNTAVVGTVAAINTASAPTYTFTPTATPTFTSTPTPEPPTATPLPPSETPLPPTPTSTPIPSATPGATVTP
jgi:tetratricopeptide (TPR) repeat protein